MSKNLQAASILALLLAIAPSFPNDFSHAQIPNPFDPFANTSQRPPKKNAATKPAQRANEWENERSAVEPQANSENRPYLRAMPDQANKNPRDWTSENPPDRNENIETRRDPQAYNEPGFRRSEVSPNTAPGNTIKREQLTPVISQNGSGLPYELWRGLDIDGVEKLIAALEIPPRSPAVHALWTKLMSAPSSVANDPQTERQFNAIRLQALYRSGIKQDVSPNNSAGTSDPILTILLVRSAIVSGQPGDACTKVRSVDLNAVPESLKPETIVIFGYCALASGNRAATELAANLSREYGLKDQAALVGLDAAAQGIKPQIPKDGPITGLAYRLLEKANWTPTPDLSNRAEPALLAALANDTTIPAQTRTTIAEAAVRLNIIPPKDLAAVYRQTGRATPDTRTGTSSWTVPPANALTPTNAMARATLFAELENEYTPIKKARLARSFLDSANRAGIYLAALEMAHDATGALLPVPEISWFAETGIEIALAARDFDRAQSWTRMSATLDPRSTGKLDHWLALIDIANPNQTTQRGASLRSVEDMALSGRFGSEHLHRLATVLDALDYNVPIPLWQAASNTPQPNTGHLPESGVLTRLQDAAKNREFGRTVLLTMQSLGPNGAEGAHMIALGDSIRALKRANLESDARRLGFEALFAIWPRVTSR